MSAVNMPVIDILGISMPAASVPAAKAVLFNISLAIFAFSIAKIVKQGQQLYYIPIFAFLLIKIVI